MALKCFELVKILRVVVGSLDYCLMDVGLMIGVG